MGLPVKVKRSKSTELQVEAAAKTTKKKQTKMFGQDVRAPTFGDHLQNTFVEVSCLEDLTHVEPRETRDDNFVWGARCCKNQQLEKRKQRMTSAAQEMG